MPFGLPAPPANAGTRDPDRILARRDMAMREARAASFLAVKSVAVVGPLVVVVVVTPGLEASPALFDGAAAAASACVHAWLHIVLNKRAVALDDPLHHS